jgi:hypothetical protein
VYTFLGLVGFAAELVSLFVIDVVGAVRGAGCWFGEVVFRMFFVEIIVGSVPHIARYNATASSGPCSRTKLTNSSAIETQ